MGRLKQRVNALEAGIRSQQQEARAAEAMPAAEMEIEEEIRWARILAVLALKSIGECSPEECRETMTRHGLPPDEIDVAISLTWQDAQARYRPRMRSQMGILPSASTGRS